MKTYAIIPSGGRGSRISGSVPKQYLKFNGKEMLAYTLDIFQRNEGIDEIIVAAEEEYFELIESVKKKYSLSKLNKIIPGGRERQDSVYNALSSIPAEPDDLIAVHDAARPLLRDEILSKALAEAKIHDNVVVAIPARDSILEGSDYVDKYLERSKIFYAQTPQLFKYKFLIEAMKRGKSENFTGTDESMLVHRASNKVKIVKGSSLNIKITTDSDIEIFSRFINS